MAVISRKNNFQIERLLLSVHFKIFPALRTPATSEVEEIAAMTDPVARNYRITECYRQLSAAMAGRTGFIANWCTFANFASRQAGETIRREDLKKTILRRLGDDRSIEEILQWIVWFAQRTGVRVTPDKIRESVLRRAMSEAVDKSAEAVGRGNNKVFKEIGWQFAHFIGLCLHDTQYNEENLQTFLGQLKDGDPPDGQRFLRQAFNRYYRAFFETDSRKASEARFFANLEIGYHEQTRLQPEIASALNAVTIDSTAILKQISKLLSDNAGFWKGLLFTVKALVGANGLLEEKAGALAERISSRLRIILTAQMMTITIPPNRVLALGKDLNMPFAVSLETIEDVELKSFLANVDPTGDSLQESGALEWSNFKERMHFIADLFRCCHENQDLFAQIEDDRK